MDIRPKTILCDIDGTLIEHRGDICTQHLIREDIVLSGTLEKLREWDKKGYKIILITGRRESTRKETEEQLSKFGIIYDQLVMGVTGGVRVLINDTKPDKETDPTAISINIKRNNGIGGVNV
jgi:hydroxymethylpyrimidine pyrophosphatase-like HAD family hydrolase